MAYLAYDGVKGKTTEFTPDKIQEEIKVGSLTLNSQRELDFYKKAKGQGKSDEEIEKTIMDSNSFLFSQGYDIDPSKVHQNEKLGLALRELDSQTSQDLENLDSRGKYRQKLAEGDYEGGLGLGKIKQMRDEFRMSTEDLKKDLNEWMPESQTGAALKFVGLLGLGAAKGAGEVGAQLNPLDGEEGLLNLIGGALSTAGTVAGATVGTALKPVGVDVFKDQREDVALFLKSSIAGIDKLIEETGELYDQGKLDEAIADNLPFLLGEVLGSGFGAGKALQGVSAVNKATGATTILGDVGKKIVSKTTDPIYKKGRVTVMQDAYVDQLGKTFVEGDLKAAATTAKQMVDAGIDVKITEAQQKLMDKSINMFKTKYGITDMSPETQKILSQIYQTQEYISSKIKNGRISLGDQNIKEPRGFFSKYTSSLQLIKDLATKSKYGDAIYKELSLDILDSVPDKKLSLGNISFKGSKETSEATLRLLLKDSKLDLDSPTRTRLLQDLNKGSVNLRDLETLKRRVTDAGTYKDLEEDFSSLVRNNIDDLGAKGRYRKLQDVYSLMKQGERIVEKGKGAGAQFAEDMTSYNSADFLFQQVAAPRGLSMVWKVLANTANFVTGKGQNATAKKLFQAVQDLEELKTTGAQVNIAKEIGKYLDIVEAGAKDIDPAKTSEIYTNLKNLIADENNVDLDKPTIDGFIKRLDEMGAKIVKEGADTTVTPTTFKTLTEIKDDFDNARVSDRSAAAFTKEKNRLEIEQQKVLAEKLKEAKNPIDIEKLLAEYNRVTKLEGDDMSIPSNVETAIKERVKELGISTGDVTGYKELTDKYFSNKLALDEEVRKAEFQASKGSVDGTNFKDLYAKASTSQEKKELVENYLDKIKEAKDEAPKGFFTDVKSLVEDDRDIPASLRKELENKAQDLQDEIFSNIELEYGLKSSITPQVVKKLTPEKLKKYNENVESASRDEKLSALEKVKELRDEKLTPTEKKNLQKMEDSIFVSIKGEISSIDDLISLDDYVLDGITSSKFTAKELKDLTKEENLKEVIDALDSRLENVTADERFQLRKGINDIKKALYQNEAEMVRSREQLVDLLELDDVSLREILGEMTAPQVKALKLDNDDIKAISARIEITKNKSEDTRASLKKILSSLDNKEEK